MSADREPRPPSRSLEELIVRYWDNALSPEELREVNHLLASNEEARALFRQFCVQTLSIRELFHVEKVCGPAEAPRGAGRTSTRKRLWFASAAVAAVLLTAALVAWGRRGAERPAPPEPVRIAWVEDFSGDAWVAGAEGTAHPARLRQPVYSGQTVFLSGAESTAEVRFHDGTRLVLNGDTAVQVFEDVQKRVCLHRGHLAAEVRPQPAGRPMILVTSQAEVQVLGTKLSLSETKQKTEVAVVQGEVRLTRLSDRQTVAMRRGEVATALKGGEKLLLGKLSGLPDTYAIDFDRLPPDWGAGELIHDGLPMGSRVGMRATPWVTEQFGTQYQIRSHNAWTSGLFELHEDSWLHIRFRQEKPGFFHVLFVARGADPTDPGAVVFEAPQFWMRRKPGVWHEVSVPLGRSKRLGRTPSQRPLPLVVYTVVVNSHLHDRGVAIDRLRVTRGTNPK